VLILDNEHRIQAEHTLSVTSWNNGTKFAWGMSLVQGDYLHVLMSLMWLIEKTGFSIFLCFRCCWPMIVTMGEAFEIQFKEYPTQSWEKALPKISVVTPCRNASGWLSQVEPLLTSSTILMVHKSIDPNIQCKKIVCCDGWYLTLTKIW